MLLILVSQVRIKCTIRTYLMHSIPLGIWVNECTISLWLVYLGTEEVTTKDNNWKYTFGVILQITTMGVIEPSASISKILNINGGGGGGGGGLLNPSHIMVYDEDWGIQSCQVQPTWFGNQTKCYFNKHNICTMTSIQLKDCTCKKRVQALKQIKKTQIYLVIVRQNALNAQWVNKSLSDVLMLKAKPQLLEQHYWLCITNASLQGI